MPFATRSRHYGRDKVNHLSEGDPTVGPLIFGGYVDYGWSIDGISMSALQQGRDLADKRFFLPRFTHEATIFRDASFGDTMIA